MKYGRIDAEDDAARYVASVTVDGVDVTRRCTMADDIEGVVELLAVNADGNFYRDETGDDLARETLRGEVVIVMQERCKHGHKLNGCELGYPGCICADEVVLAEMGG